MSMKLSAESVEDFYNRRLRDKKPLTDEECASITKGILMGLSYLHDEKNIIHRDIKTQNVLITNEKDLS